MEVVHRKDKQIDFLKIEGQCKRDDEKYFTCRAGKEMGQCGEGIIVTA